jgi:uncharacterized ferritin-like protein (DUF455 family)
VSAAPDPLFPSLAAAARTIVATPDPAAKAGLAVAAAAAWRDRRLSLARPTLDPALPDRPGRPDRPVLLAPRDMPKRSTRPGEGRLALIHALAHIELNAIDLAWDIVGRFAGVDLPRSFFDDWVRVGVEEAGHFRLLSGRLADLGHAYGDLPAHDGLWQAAQETGHSLTARLAVVPLVLEARGLDVTPSMSARARAEGDLETAEILAVIYRDEKGHVAIGAKWFRFLCDREGAAPEPTFQALVRRHFRGGLKPPFNDRARSEAGLTPGFYRPLVLMGK